MNDHRHVWLLRHIEQRIREGYTGRVVFTLDFNQGGIRNARADEAKLIGRYPEPATAGGKEQ